MIELDTLIPIYGGPRGNTVEDVAEFLRLRIQEGALVRGDQVPPERDLAMALGVGRSTLSGALNRLQAEGYVERRRGGRGGTYVTDLMRTVETWCRRMAGDVQAFRDAFEYRLALETYAAGLAAQRRTPRDLAVMRQAQAKLEVLQPSSDEAATAHPDWRTEVRRADFRFHGAVASACQSQMLARAVLDARAMLFTGFLMGHWEETRTWSQVVDTTSDHATILTAIANGRREAARRAMEGHLITAQTRLEGIIREYAARPSHSSTA